jgi:hypothetical protein
MKADTTRFNADMRKARYPDHPPGGSTKTHGKAVQGNIAASAPTPTSPNDDDYDYYEATSEVAAHLMASEDTDITAEYIDKDIITADYTDKFLRDNDYFPKETNPVLTTANMMEEFLLLEDKEPQQIVKDPIPFCTNKMSKTSHWRKKLKKKQKHPSEDPIPFRTNKFLTTVSQTKTDPSLATVLSPPPPALLHQNHSLYTYLTSNLFSP